MSLCYFLSFFWGEVLCIEGHYALMVVKTVRARKRGFGPSFSVSIREMPGIGISRKKILKRWDMQRKRPDAMRQGALGFMLADYS